MVYDLSIEPWRPFRVVTYDDKKDVPITDLTWSLDSTRIIFINQLVWAAYILVTEDHQALNVIG
ncbi:hypothetical protein DPMN_133851 [Dreissena polymorpha]|uniref:Uncharacterized protein n=1 Tax=Dreissena polymorpha TaxID=45954 RepID=A0A9D4G0X4_DREPO|nr:hypothetical protein DPMN_133851 [Dreissena polymorpha]